MMIIFNFLMYGNFDWVFKISPFCLTSAYIEKKKVR